MHLHDRVVRSGLFEDARFEMEFSRDERLFYAGLVLLAEDSGCLADDVWEFKRHLFPLDFDVTADVLTLWRDHFISAGKLVRYREHGRDYVWLRNFSRHQSRRNSEAPSLPLPSWLAWKPYPSKDGKDKATGSYEIAAELVPEVVDADAEAGSASTEAGGASSVAGGAGDWDGEKDLERDGEGEHEGASRLPPRPATCLTAEEQPIADVLRSVDQYPADDAADAKILRALATEFPAVDLLAAARGWSAYKLDKPLRPKSNPRSQFRSWVRIESERLAEVRNGHHRLTGAHGAEVRNGVVASPASEDDAPYHRQWLLPPEEQAAIAAASEAGDAW